MQRLLSGAAGSGNDSERDYQPGARVRLWGRDMFSQMCLLAMD